MTQEEWSKHAMMPMGLAKLKFETAMRNKYGGNLEKYFNMKKGKV
jgi:hypothetical protein